IFTLPEYIVNDEVATIPGIDGQKMSKSYDNAIDIFMETEKKLQKRCNKIISSSTPLGEPLEFNGCNIYNLASLFLDKDGKKELQNRYQSGQEGYGHFKKYLKELIWSEFEEAREKRAYYLENPDIVRDILNDGANKMRKIADAKMASVREAVGIL
ncbi:MAG: tryptophan--tRNA ligase, partial [Sulfurovaceae bacterium]|nr:tryptophan--tRNA ligase [Sulfurovaceae bacterium]